MTFKFSTKLSDSPQIIEEKPQTVHWDGIELTVASENIEKPTVWSINEDRHALIVHLGGTINQIETEIDRRGSKINPPTAGEFWLIPANSKYFSYTRGETVRYAEIYFEKDYLSKVFGEKKPEVELLSHIGWYDNFLYQNVKQLVSLVRQTDDISKLMSENISQTLCLYLFNNFTANSTKQKTEPIKFSPKKYALIQEYIQENLTEQITLEKLAKVAGMNSHTLLRSFGKTFGTTPAQYIIEQRIRKARWLLINSDKDITTIAHETGFSSHSHLTTTFKKNINLSPREFRRNRFL